MALAAAVLVFSAVGAANLLALQTAAPPAGETQQSNGQPAREQPAPAPDEAGAGNASPQPADEILQIENRLRREVLDDRADTVYWWLQATAIIFAVLGVFATLGSYFAYTRFRDQFREEARKSMEASREHAEEARRFAEETRRSRDTAEAHVREMTAESVKDNPKGAKEAAEKVQGDPAASPIGRAFAAAISLQGQGKIEAATRKWRSIADVTEGIDKNIEARAWFSIGYLCGEKSDFKAAVNAYDKAIRLTPDEAAAYNNRGNAKNTLGLYKEAIGDYDEALRLKPDYAEAYSNRGVAKAALGRRKEAITDHDEAIRLKPDYAAAYSNRGAAKAALGQHKEAIGDYDEALRLKPGYAEAYGNRGNAKAALGRHKQAITDYDEMLRLKPDEALTYNNRGVVNALSGRLNEARKDYQTALDLARKQGKEEVAAKAKRALENLGEEKSS